MQLMGTKSNVGCAGYCKEIGDWASGVQSFRSTGGANPVRAELRDQKDSTAVETKSAKECLRW